MMAPKSEEQTKSGNVRLVDFGSSLPALGLDF